MQTAVNLGKMRSFGVLSVVNCEYSGKSVYKHLVSELGITGIDFLLPDYTHDTFYGSALSYGEFLCDVFDVWKQDKKEIINVRYFSSIINSFLGIEYCGRTDLSPNHDQCAAVTISSDGELRADDTLLSTLSPFIHTGKTVSNVSLAEYLKEPIFQQLEESSKIMPLECQNCCWVNICRGGQPVHRYSHANNFNNPSVMCEGLKMFYAHVTQYLVDNGLPYSFIQDRLIEKLN